MSRRKNKNGKGRGRAVAVAAGVEVAAAVAMTVTGPGAGAEKGGAEAESWAESGARGLYKQRRRGKGVSAIRRQHSSALVFSYILFHWELEASTRTFIT